LSDWLVKFLTKSKIKAWQVETYYEVANSLMTSTHANIPMVKQTIQLSFDKEAVMKRVDGRRSVFLDTNCWSHMAAEIDQTACRVRDQLKELVASARVFCPLSWGLIEELFPLSGESLFRRAELMEELSLNVIYVMRKELFQWELDRSIRRCHGDITANSLDGLYAPPAAFAGSAPSDEVSISPEALASAKVFIKENLSKIGIVELARLMGGTKFHATPPGYSEAAKKVKQKYKGNKKQLFLAEAGNCFHMYIAPFLITYPPQLIASWSSQFGLSIEEEMWFQNALAELPALHNYIDVMIVADQQPGRKDSNNDFMDNEIMVAPLAYADVFVAKDKGIRDILQNRTKILNRTKCQYFDSLAALEPWLNGMF
jgi:hypothetical protein